MNRVFCAFPALVISVFWSACADAAESCVVGPAYSAVVHERSDPVGEDIYVRSTSGQRAVDCAPLRRKGDFKAVDAEEAGYFAWLDGHYLAVDIGTGPDRELRIVDLRTRKVIWRGAVADGSGTKGDGPRVIQRVGDKLALAACPKAWRVANRADTVAASAHRVTELHFDVATGRMLAIGRSGCTILQSDMR